MRYDEEARRSAGRHPITLSRRQLLGRTSSGLASLAGLYLAACSSSGKPRAGGTSAPRQAPTGAINASTPQAATSPQPGGRFNVSFTIPNAPLDPQGASSLPQFLTAGVYSRLLRFKNGLDPNAIADHNVEPDLAMQVESPDAGTWTFKLRSDAKFANLAPVNGHAVEAEDVKATFTRALTKATNPNRAALSMIDPDQIQTPDATTVSFRLKYPYAAFQQLMASSAYSLILPREALAGSLDPSKQVIGSGPFLLDSFQPDSQYLYKKNVDWFDKALGTQVDEVRVAIIVDTNTAEAQFTSKQLDTLSVPIVDLQTMQRNNPKASVLKAHYGASMPIYLPMGDTGSPFQDIRVRRAVSMALDRDSLIKAVYSGEGEMPVFVPTYMGKWSLTVQQRDPSLAQWYKFDPAEARKLLAAAGHTDLELKLLYVQQFGGVYQTLAEAVSNMLIKSGIKTTLVSQDYNQDFIKGGHGSRQGNFKDNEMVFGAIAPYTDADEFVFGYFHSSSATNAEKLNDPAYDAMVDKSR